ncbi:methylmalonyl-CoA mutase family protein [Actinokineospora sp. NPDC004072]
MTADGLVLAGEHPAASREQWRELVAGVLRKSGAALGDQPVEAVLAARTYDGIEIAPLYTAADAAPAAGMPGLPPYTRGARPDGHVRGGWDVRQRHADPATTAAAVLADLENGVSSLWLVAGGSGIPVARLADVLADVHLDLAPVTLDAGAEFADAAAELLRVHAEKGVPAAETRGSLGADPIGHQARTATAPDLAAAASLATSAAEYPNLRAITVDGLPYHDAGGSDAQELGAAIAAGVAYLRALTEDLPVARAAELLEFRFAATADQFLTIAKLRAARRLWARVGEVSGFTAPQRQHAVTATAMLSRRDPWVNMLRATLGCFGAGVGGADAVTVLPFDAAIGLPDAFARRIARNTQSVLLEESRLAGVIDPAGGSWYVERLTDDLARAAWAWFTEIERHGGIVAAQGSGLVADRIAETWAARRDNLAHRVDALTGVSEFPHLAEQPVERPPAPAAPAGGLPVHRYAEEFEDLRDRSDRALAATGARPRVFLATLGPVAAHTARATFAANLFQAGGIETPADAVERYDGSAVVCLCGTDNAYAEQAADAVAALRAAGARKVLLAGKPSDEYQVDGFVHTGCDAIAVLRQIHADLEVPA